jgi:hypothetical protein
MYNGRQRQTVKKPKKSYENRLNDNHSPIGVLDNSKNDLVFSQSDGQVLLQVRNSLLVLPGTVDD